MSSDKKLSRRTLREFVFKFLYASEFLGDDGVGELLNDERLEDVLKNSFSEDGRLPDEEERCFLAARVRNAIEKKHELDAVISEYSESWKISRMNRVDLSILRLAVYEMLFDDDIPEGVAINEAVELAKKYGSGDSQAFVNGLLGKIAAEKRT